MLETILDHIITKTLLNNLGLIPLILLLFKAPRIRMLNWFSGLFDEIPTMKLNNEITWLVFQNSLANSMIIQINQGITHPLNKVHIETNMKIYKGHGGNGFIDMIYESYIKLECV